MKKFIKKIMAGIAVMLLLMTTTALAEEVSREQIKGLDEQVQEIKSDVLSIAAELNKLEEKLLYPSHTQIAIFVSLTPEDESQVDYVDISIDGDPIIHHIYTFKELEALQKGGVQRIYTGNVTTGNHEMMVTFNGKSAGGSDFQKTETIQVEKDVAPKIVEIVLAQESITFRDR